MTKWTLRGGARRFGVVTVLGSAVLVSACATSKVSGPSAFQLEIKPPVDIGPLESVANTDGKLMVRVSNVAALTCENCETSAPGRSFSVDDAVATEVDASYFFTPNIAVEFSAAASSHAVNGDCLIDCSAELGDQPALFMSLTGQYHFTQFSDVVKPYVGAGVAHSTFFDTDSSFGPALQAGLDIEINEGLFFNIDVKKMFGGITDRRSTPFGPLETRVDWDPLMIGIGFGYRFLPRTAPSDRYRPPERRRAPHRRADRLTVHRHSRRASKTRERLAA